MSIEYAKVINEVEELTIDAISEYLEKIDAICLIPICVHVAENVIATSSSGIFGTYHIGVSDYDMRFGLCLHIIRTKIMNPLFSKHFKEGKLPIIVFYRERDIFSCFRKFSYLTIEVEVQDDSRLNC